MARDAQLSIYHLYDHLLHELLSSHEDLRERGKVGGAERLATVAQLACSGLGLGLGLEFGLGLGLGLG